MTGRARSGLVLVRISHLVGSTPVCVLLFEWALPASFTTPPALEATPLSQQDHHLSDAWVAAFEPLPLASQPIHASSYFLLQIWLGSSHSQSLPDGACVALLYRCHLLLHLLLSLGLFRGPFGMGRIASGQNQPLVASRMPHGALWVGCFQSDG